MPIRNDGVYVPYSLGSSIVATGLQSAVQLPVSKHDSVAVKAKLTGAGAVSAAVDIYGNTENANTGGQFLGTLAPSGTLLASDGLMFPTYPYMYANVTSLIGSPTLNIDVGA